MDGRVGVKGSPDHSVSLWDVAVVANPIRDADGDQAKEAMKLMKARTGPVLDDGAAPGLQAREYSAPERATWASGVHAAIVEIDAENPNAHDLEVRGCPRLWPGDQPDGWSRARFTAAWPRESVGLSTSGLFMTTRRSRSPALLWIT